MSLNLISFERICDEAFDRMSRNRRKPVRFAPVLRTMVMYMLTRPSWVEVCFARVVRAAVQKANSRSPYMHLSRYMFGCEQTVRKKRQSALAAKVGQTDHLSHPWIGTSCSYSRLTDISCNQYKAPASPPVSAMTDIKPHAG